MSRNGTRYTDEFKKQIVEYYRSGQSVNHLSSKYGATSITIYKWINQLSPVVISEGEGISTEDYQAIQKRIAELEMECKILKKAAAIVWGTQNKKGAQLRRNDCQEKASSIAHVSHGSQIHSSKVSS